MKINVIIILYIINSFAPPQAQRNEVNYFIISNTLLT